jgi:3D (Asp-Asp-Asp) domain-containing protein
VLDAHIDSLSVRFWIAAWCAASLALWTAGCITAAIRPPADARCMTVPMLLTGYCNCGKCCNWESSWLRGPTISSGPHKGEPKKVGFTSGGTEARHGTIAADIARYPYGTIVEIPGYGFGRVEDTGSAIKGDHLDLWFPDHDKAQQWGHQRKLVKIWLPLKR